MNEVKEYEYPYQEDHYDCEIKIIGNNKTEKVFNYFSNTPKD